MMMTLHVYKTSKTKPTPSKQQKVMKQAIHTIHFYYWAQPRSPSSSLDHVLVTTFHWKNTNTNTISSVWCTWYKCYAMTKVQSGTTPPPCYSRNGEEKSHRNNSLSMLKDHREFVNHLLTIWSLQKNSWSVVQLLWLLHKPYQLLQYFKYFRTMYISYLA